MQRNGRQAKWQCDRGIDPKPLAPQLALEPPGCPAIPLAPARSILDRIGNTPLVEVGSLVPAGAAHILGKTESENPTGSMKERVALAMIEAAERDGRLAPGRRVRAWMTGALPREELWFKAVPPVNMAPDIVRHVEPKILRVILGAIRQGEAINVLYQSLTNT